MCRRLREGSPRGGVEHAATHDPFVLRYGIRELNGDAWTGRGLLRCALADAGEAQAERGGHGARATHVHCQLR